jgi:putative permease
MKTQVARWIKPVFILTFLVFSVVVLFVVAGLAELLVIGALLAYILDPLATILESRGLSRAAATALIFFLLVAAMAALLGLTLPRLATEVQRLQSGAYATETGAIIARVEALLRDKLAFLGMGNINLADQVQAFRTSATEKLVEFMVKEGPTMIAHLVAIPFIVFFLIKDGRELKKTVISLVPNRYFEFALNLLFKMDMQLGNFLRGQFLDALIFGILTTVALWILDVPYFLVLGAFAGLANLIPYAGPIVGGLASVLVTVVFSPDISRVLYVILAFVLAKLIDDAVIQPVVVAKSVDIHPLVVLLVIIIGGSFFGILGMLLAVPAMGFLKVAVEETVKTVRKYQFD